METKVEELQALLDGGATVLNVGKHQGHAEIRGAVRYRPHDLLTPEHLVIPIAPDKPVVLYDEKGDAAETRDIAEKLARNGFSDVRILTGGYAAWHEANGATQESSQEQVVPPSRSSEAQGLDRRI